MREAEDAFHCTKEKYYDKSHQHSTFSVHCGHRVRKDIRAGVPGRQARNENMFEHLIDFEPPVVEASGKDVSDLGRSTPEQILNAQVNTTKWLEQLGIEDDHTILKEAEATAARRVFTALATNTPPSEIKTHLTQLKTPESVRHLVTMLSAYDWEFVEQAKQMRGMAVAKIIEETNHPDARIRLKAIEMLGRVTEVALFTDRVEIKKTDMTEAEIDRRLKEKLSKFMNITDVEVIDVEEVVPAETIEVSAHSQVDPTPDEPK